VRHMVVVIPARDEQALVARCLSSVIAAGRYLRSRHPAIGVSIVLVADDCTDDTSLIARGFDDVSVIDIDAGNVGVARATGVHAALAAVSVPTSEVWIANTDADSVVPRRWLVEQLRQARHGADLVVGTVRPEFADLTEEQVRAWSARRTAAPNGHVHGANLGVGADVYLAAGGFEPIAEHEDVGLAERCVRAGATMVATARCEVTTSGRPVGRTPGGYASYLTTDLLADPAL